MHEEILVLLTLNLSVTANSYTVKDVEEFLSEALKLKGLEHANLLTVLGIVIEENRPYMALPLMDHGDMKSFLIQPEQVCENCFCKLCLSGEGNSYNLYCVSAHGGAIHKNTT